MGPTITSTPIPDALSEYISIVEKTNHQLGLGIDLASLMVAILSVLIALIAIFVAIALWKNSKEQKDIMENFYANQEKIIKEKNKSVERVEEKFENLISQYRKKLKLASKKNKEKIQEAINELGKEKASVGAYIGATSVLGPQRAQGGWFIYTAPKKNMICSSCGKSFDYFDDSNKTLVTYLDQSGMKTVYCTHCGSANIASA